MSLKARITIAVFVLLAIALAILEFWIATDVSALLEQQANTSEAAAKASLAELRRAFIFYYAITVVLVASTVAVILKLLFRPFDTLVSGVHGYANIHDPRPLPEKGPKEIVTLIKALNTMSQDSFEQSISLTRAKLDAEALSRSRSEFLSRMSHEIRTPLNGIIGYTQLLQKNFGRASDLPPKALEFINKTDTAASLLLRLINNVLDLAKFEAGSITVSMESIDLKKTLVSIFEMNQSKAMEKGIDYELNFADDLPSFYQTDSSKLTQLVTNLLGNAIKFTPSEKKVTLSVAPHKDGVLIQVQDQGIGIPKHKIKTIFKPFTQADVSTQRQYGGTGLGLSIVNHIVNQLEGTIKVDSQEGEGTTFSVYLPMQSCTAATIEEQVDLNVRFDGDQRILVIEDNQMNQELVSQLLSDYGLEKVTIASDGLQGYQAVQENDYDLILTDYHMPECNGLDCTEKIKALWQSQGKASTPIVMVTADVTAETREKGKQVGVDAYMSKPVEVTVLVQVLCRFLKYSEAVEECGGNVKPCNQLPDEVAIECGSIIREIALLPEHRSFEVLDHLDTIREKLSGYEPNYFEQLQALESSALAGNQTKVREIASNLSAKLSDAKES